jgi:DivIVA domain-containing protein
VAEAGFSTTRRGFNQGEVRAFLTSVAGELGRLQERQRQLEAELHSARSAPPASVELDDETVANLLGEETLRVLHTARESASEIKIRAEDNAARILRDANDEANRIRQETEVEVARRRYDASADAEAEVALAKQQGREMVNEARAYRERVLADLERRTTLARHQIEELVHGRDRLLQVFERARLVAVDVTSDLQAIDGPDELVNLSPTTGPVPLMVPADREPDDRADDSTASEAEPTAAETELIDLVDAATSADADQIDEIDETTELVDAGSDDAGDDDTDADDDGSTDEPAATSETARDANVVSLFRGRAAPDDAADDTEAVDADTETADGDTEAGGADAEAAGDDAGEEDRPDVGGIFARLRNEADDADEADADTDVEQTDSTEAADEAVAEENTDDEASADESTEAADAELDEPTSFSRRDAAIVPLIVGGARKIKRVLADEQNGVLDRLRQNEPVTKLDDLLPDLNEHLAVYVTALADDLAGAAAAGAGELGINDTKTLRRKLDKTGALESTHDLVRVDLLRPLRSRLARAVSDGAGDNEQITKRVRAVYREWKTQHIDDQLDDVFRFAHGGGLAVSVEPGTPLVWSIDAGHPACPDCEDNSLAGSVAAGDAFPTGHTAAPAHPGCRCLTLPAGQ